MSSAWSNLATVTYKRTYARTIWEAVSWENPEARVEHWPETVERAIAGNVRGRDVPEREVERLRYFLTERKATPGGRGLWFSGTEYHGRIGGAGVCNCWFTTGADPENFVWTQDCLMLGGGVGFSVEHEYVSKLPVVRRDVVVVNKDTKDADFVVPDSREGWCELTRRVLEAFFVTGRSFSYSTICLRPYGEPIRGFGGTACGPRPVKACVAKIAAILGARAGEHVRPIDAVDVVCSIGEMVKAGNVRRSAILILGDPWDAEYLRAKRWDLGAMPTQRASANFSVAASRPEDLYHPFFWETYQAGEPFGIVNRSTIQTFGRMGERRPDAAVGVNPCAEATLEDGEPCNLQEIALPRIESPDEFVEAARLMHRWGKRVTLDQWHQEKTAAVVARNRRVGTSITGCLQSPLFRPESLDRAYEAIQRENKEYAKELGIPPSIRTTVVKPSGTLSKLMDVQCEGVHPAWSRHFVQRIRLSANDPLLGELRGVGHHVEPERRSDGTHDLRTYVADFYVSVPEGVPTADGEWDTWRQLDALLVAQRHWADQAVSVTVTYRADELPRLKEWITSHLGEVKSASFLRHSGHGFDQAPKEAITRELYEELVGHLSPLGGAALEPAPADAPLVDECMNGLCPAK